MARPLAIVVLVLALNPRVLCAQAVEVSPFYGYRFGGGFFELATGRPVDLDGAPAIGVTVNVPLWEGLQFEGLFTHQRGDVYTSATPFGPVTRWQVAVDHWLAGALQEFAGARVRPFATGMFGLTRYAVEGDSEMRFAVTAGGGVKLFPASRVGLRLDGRVMTTVLDADTRAVACAPGRCFIGLHVNVAWQAEFTSAVILRFP
jgi:hypothetical protein